MATNRLFTQPTINNKTKKIDFTEEELSQLNIYKQKDQELEKQERRLRDQLKKIELERQQTQQKIAEVSTSTDKELEELFKQKMSLGNSIGLPISHKVSCQFNKNSQKLYITIDRCADEKAVDSMFNELIESSDFKTKIIGNNCDNIKVIIDLSYRDILVNNLNLASKLRDLKFKIVC